MLERYFKVLVFSYYLKRVQVSVFEKIEHSFEPMSRKLREAAVKYTKSLKSD